MYVCMYVCMHCLTPLSAQCGCTSRSPHPVRQGNTHCDAPIRAETYSFIYSTYIHTYSWSITCLGVEVIQVVAELSRDEHELVIEEHVSGLRHPHPVVREGGNGHHRFQPGRVLREIEVLTTRIVYVCVHIRTTYVSIYVCTVCITTFPIRTLVRLEMGGLIR